MCYSLFINIISTHPGKHSKPLCSVKEIYSCEVLLLKHYRLWMSEDVV